MHATNQTPRSLLHNRWRRAWRLLGSTRLAAILLASLLLAALLGTLLPQMPASPATHQSWLAAVELRYGSTTSLLSALGLFHLYRTPGFVALLVALLLNTLLCTAQRLPRLWRSLTRPPRATQPDAFFQGFAHRAEWTLSSLQEGLTAAQRVLIRRRYRIHLDPAPTPSPSSGTGGAYLLAERGSWARAGTLLSHLALLLLLILLLARPALRWQQSSLVLLPGQAAEVGRGAGLAVQAGTLTIDRYSGGQPRDYRVPLTVIPEAAPIVTGTVRLSRPLSVRGFAFHLQGYGPAAQIEAPEGTFRVAFAGDQAQEVTLPQASLKLRLAYQPEADTVFVEATATDGSLVGSGSVASGQQIEALGTPLTVDLTTYTTWQVSRDPTFALVLGTSGLLLLGIVLSLWVPQRRLWLRLDGQSVQMVGSGYLDHEFDAIAAELIPGAIDEAHGEPDGQ